MKTCVPYASRVKWDSVLRHVEIIYKLPCKLTLYYLCCGVGCGFPTSSDSKASACNAGDWVWSLGQEDPLEKEMATHSSILAWKIPWTEEPGELQCMRLQRVGHKTNTHTHTHTEDWVSSSMSPQKLMPQRCRNTILMEEKIEHRAHFTSRSLVRIVPNGNSDCRGLFLPGAINKGKANLHLQVTPLRTIPSG